MMNTRLSPWSTAVVTERISTVVPADDAVVKISAMKKPEQRPRRQHCHPHYHGNGVSSTTRRTLYCCCTLLFLAAPEWSISLSLVAASSSSSSSSNHHPIFIGRTNHHHHHSQQQQQQQQQRPFLLRRLDQWIRRRGNRSSHEFLQGSLASSASSSSSVEDTSTNTDPRHSSSLVSAEEMAALAIYSEQRASLDEKQVQLVSNSHHKNRSSNKSPGDGAQSSPFRNVLKHLRRQFTSTSTTSATRDSSMTSVPRQNYQLDNNYNTIHNKNDHTTNHGDTTVNPWLKVLAAIPFKKLAEMGILALLFYNIFQAATEIVGEYTQELMGGNNAGGFSREHVQQVLAFVEDIPPDVREKLQRAQQQHSPLVIDESLTASLPHLPTLSMAQKLVLAGLPLRTTSSSSSSSGGGGVTKPSVESILLSLNKAEAAILQQCLWVPPLPPTTRNSRTTTATTTSWDDVVGLTRVKTGLLTQLQSILGHTKSPVYDSLFEHSSGMAGVLLYGPPGCGKSFLIKTLSAQARVPCLVITPSVFLRKYVGETNQQCRTLFSLAQKLAPCILCIDEVDGLFRERSGNEHEVSRDLKTELLQYLDGMMSAAPIDPSTGRRRKNLVVAATNRPFDVDPAILRRLTQSYLVDLPDVASRAMILRHVLRKVPQDPGMDIAAVASQTEGYSPSDLRQLLQQAASMGPLRESSSNPRPLTTQDIVQAMSAVPPTPLSNQYRWALSNFAQAQNPNPIQQIAVGGPGAGGSATGGGGGSQQTQVISKWETDYGNFYHLGSLQIDSETWDQLADLAESIAEEDSDDDDDESEDAE